MWLGVEFPCSFFFLLSSFAPFRRVTDMFGYSALPLIFNGRNINGLWMDIPIFPSNVMAGYSSVINGLSVMDFTEGGEGEGV